MVEKINSVVIFLRSCATSIWWVLGFRKKRHIDIACIVITAICIFIFIA